MNDEPLHISFYSVVVKRKALSTRYPGGAEEFDRVLAARSNDALSLAVTMSLDDANRLFTRLHKAGLVPGEDFGLVGMYDGVLVPCHGIRIVRDEDELGVVCDRHAVADEGYRYQPEDEAYSWQPPEPEVVPEAPQDAVSSGPRRVVFGSGAVHWLYDDDDDDDVNE